MVRVQQVTVKRVIGERWAIWARATFIHLFPISCIISVCNSKRNHSIMSLLRAPTILHITLVLPTFMCSLLLVFHANNKSSSFLDTGSRFGPSPTATATILMAKFTWENVVYLRPTRAIAWSQNSYSLFTKVGATSLVTIFLQVFPSPRHYLRTVSPF